MDPRYRRSRERLRAAVYRLAGQRPITDVSVTELCREAGVTRDTLYRHAKSPVDLLGEEVARITETDPQETEPGADVWAFMVAAETALLEHVALHAAVYRNAMQPHLVCRYGSGLSRSSANHSSTVPSGAPTSSPR